MNQRFNTIYTVIVFFMIITLCVLCKAFFSLSRPWKIFIFYLLKFLPFMLKLEFTWKWYLCEVKSQVLTAFSSEWIFHWLGSIYRKELAFPLCSTLPILLSMKYSYMRRSASVLSIMFLWFICISLCKYYIVFTTRAYSKSGCLIIHVF